VRSDCTLIFYFIKYFIFVNRLFMLVDRVFTKSIVPFKKTALSKEEYALLMAIIFSNPSK